MASVIVPVGSVGEAQNAATGGTLTASYTVDAAATYLLVAVHQGFNADLVSGVTYGGVALTNLVELNANNNYAVALFGLANPTPGTANLVVTAATTSTRLALTAQAFGGAPITAGTTASAQSVSAGTTAAVTVASAVGELVVGALTGNYGNNKTVAVGAGQTALSNRDSTGWTQDFAASYQDGAASVTHQYTWTTTMPWVVAAVSLVPSGTTVSPTGLALTSAVGSPSVAVPAALTVAVSGLPLAAALSSYETSTSVALTPDTGALTARLGGTPQVVIVNPALPDPTPIISGRQLALAPLRPSATPPQIIQYVNDAFGKVQLAVGDPPMMPLRSTTEVVSVVGATTIDTATELLRENSRVEMVRVLPTIPIAGATTMSVGDATTAARFRAAAAVPTAGIVCLAHHDTGGSVVAANARLRLTFDTAPTTGAVKLEVFYRQYVAPTLG